MKKYFFIAVAAVVALAACTKNEIKTPETKGREISYKAVNAKNTVSKAIINTTYYAPTDPAFGIWGLYQETNWATNKSNNVWIGGSASAATQITYAKDAENTTGSEAWRNAASVDYWPLTGSLVFMGYSPYTNVSSKAAISVADSKATLTVTDFQTTTGSWVDDLMWSDAVEKAANDTNYDKDGSGTTTYDGVPVVFHHALSQIAIYAKTDKDYATKDYTFTITALSMTIDDKATLTVKDDPTSDATVTWGEPATDATRTVLSAASPALTDSFVKQGEAFLVIPQNLSGNDILTITYQVVHNGVTSTATKTINLYKGETDLTDGNHDDDNLASFAKNTKYNLNLVFSMDEIRYSPSVADWEGPAEVEYEVPKDANI